MHVMFSLPNKGIHRDQVNFAGFDMKFQISFRSSQIDWQLRYHIAKTAANFRSSEQISESDRQKLFETHCKRETVHKMAALSKLVI